MSRLKNKSILFRTVVKLRAFYENFTFFSNQDREILLENPWSCLFKRYQSGDEFGTVVLSQLFHISVQIWPRYLYATF